MLGESTTYRCADISVIHPSVCHCSIWKALEWLFSAQEHSGWEPKAELTKSLIRSHLMGHAWRAERGGNQPPLKSEPSKSTDKSYNSFAFKGSESELTLISASPGSVFYKQYFSPHLQQIRKQGCHFLHLTDEIQRLRYTQLLAMLSGSSKLCPTALDQKQEESDSVPKLLHMPVNVFLSSAVLLYLKRVLY